MGKETKEEVEHLSKLASETLRGLTKHSQESEPIFQFTLDKIVSQAKSLEPKKRIDYGEALVKILESNNQMETIIKEIDSMYRGLTT